MLQFFKGAFCLNLKLSDISLLKCVLCLYLLYLRLLHYIKNIGGINSVFHVQSELTSPTGLHRIYYL